ncbi:MAG: IucA/IucC family siderophore biosynthesis protein, partial [Haladaptatus sp.]
MSHLSEVDERTTADTSAVAASATTHAFLNSYLRETGAGELVASSATEEAIRFELPTVGVEIVAPLAYRSPTGRHLFDLPVRFRTGDDDDWTDLDYATLASLVVKELSLERSGDNVADELLSRVLSSKRATER